jgi:hypothetical protein
MGREGSTLWFVQSPCPRCGAELTVDATECPVCAYGEVEEIVILEVQRPPAGGYGGVPREGQPRPAVAGPSALPRVLVALAFLVVVIVVIFAAVR